MHTSFYAPPSAGDLKLILARERESGWNHAIYRFLYNCGDQDVRLWRLLNELTRQFRTDSRAHTRQVIRSILADLQVLIRAQKIQRYRRGYVRVHPQFLAACRNAPSHLAA
ncbi:MAG: hypothetical protein ACYDH9_23735 [Limisphaerales bacterium]